MSLKTYKGEIYSVDNDLLSFQLKEKSNIFYAAKWVLLKKTFFIPNSFISIEICHDTEDKYPILCNQCQIEFPTKTQDYNKTLLVLIMKYDLDEDYMKEIYKLHRNVFIRCFKTFDITDGKIIVQVLNEIFLIINKNQFYLKPISACQIVDDTNIKYQSFPFWTYTFNDERFNQKDNVSNYIIGRLMVHDTFGVPILVDSQWRVPVLIFKNKEIEKYTNRFVLIKKALFVAEVFNVPNQQTDSTASCVIIDTDDIIPLNSISLNITNNIVNDLKMKSERFKVNLNHIGPILKGQNQEECWIEAHNSELGKIFIVLSGELIKMKPFLSTNYEYIIEHQEPLKSYKWREIDRLYKLPGFKFMKSTTKFLKNSRSNINPEKLLNVEEALLHLQEKKDEINITGLIVRKTFKTPVFAESFYAGKRYPLPFGAPGNSAHVIHLEGNDDKEIKIFLNDFNRYFFPFGLIPGMVVNIRRVKPQSRNYFKCTPLTTFELVEFNKPLITPANLHHFQKKYREKEQVIFLGIRQQQLLPFNVIYAYQLKSVCVRKGLICYNDVKQRIEIDILLDCHDICGNFQLEVNCESVLKSLLSAHKPGYEVFLKAIKEIKYFQYCALDIIQNNVQPIGELNIFKHSLNWAMYTWSLKIHHIDVYIRRIRDVNSIPLYTTVDL